MYSVHERKGFLNLRYLNLLTSFSWTKLHYGVTLFCREFMGFVVQNALSMKYF